MTQLDSLLMQLSVALKAADFEAIANVAAGLETTAFPTDRAGLLRIARLAHENEVMLTAASKGLQSAKRRIEDLRKGQQLTTYNKEGVKSERASPPARSHRL